MSGQPDGTLLVYLDQSEQANTLSRYFGLIAGVTLLLLGAGVATPIALAWTPGRQRREAEERLRYLETHDPLTGLPNRKAFDDLLTNAMATMQRNRTHIAVLRLDVDKFHEINDSVDLATGDAVLREVGNAISSGCAPATSWRGVRATNLPWPWSISTISARSWPSWITWPRRCVFPFALPTRSSCAP